MAGKTIENNTVHVDKLENESYLPIANVSRIMKKSLPTNAKISKDAKETVQQCVSEFISFVTGEASDKCHREKRKTITGDDLLWAMTTLGFENYVRHLQIYLKYYKCGTIGDITQTSEGASVMEENSSSAKTNDTVISEGNIEKTTTNSAHVCDSLPDFKRSPGLSPNYSYSVIHYGEQYY